MPTSMIRLLAGLISAILLLAFLLLYGNAIWKTWSETSTPAPFAAEYVYVATALAGLVGGVVAMVFNQNIPDDPRGAAANGHVPAFGFGPASVAAGRSFAPRTQNVLAWLAVAYVITYLLVGVGAIATWILADHPPDLIKNLALISIGTFLAIARFFFNIPKPDDPQPPAAPANAPTGQLEV